MAARHTEAKNLYVTLTRHAATAHEINEAAWGQLAASLVTGDDGLESAFRQLEALPDKHLSDRVRLECARLSVARIRGTRPNPLEGARLVANVSDPWVRSAWGHAHGYVLLLAARYSEAHAVLRGTRSDLDERGLAFAQPHIDWALAASELGLRHFVRCESLLRRIERRPEYSRDQYSQLNVRALQARVHLAQQRPKDALDTTSDDFNDPTSPVMYGEYLATRAVALAVLGNEREANNAASEATSVTSSAETRILCSAVPALLSLKTGEPDESAVSSVLDQASSADIWDGVVCVIRAAPEVLTSMALVPQHRTELREVLLRSNDFALAKPFGRFSRPTDASGVLSPREREVMEHLRQGKRNAEIAASLFIAVATVKRHLDHIYDKLGTRSRAGAISRYAEIEIGETVDAATGADS